MSYSPELKGWRRPVVIFGAAIGVMSVAGACSSGASGSEGSHSVYQIQCKDGQIDQTQDLNPNDDGSPGSISRTIFDYPVVNGTFEITIETNSDDLKNGQYKLTEQFVPSTKPTTINLQTLPARVIKADNGAQLTINLPPSLVPHPTTSPDPASSQIPAGEGVGPLPWHLAVDPAEKTARITGPC